MGRCGGLGKLTPMHQWPSPYQTRFACLVFTDVAVDFFSVGGSIVPGSLQVGRLQAPDGKEDFFVG
jgi:hypothetical protein